ncbi:hypothetical protein FH603_5859, partial [Spirosoma sp. LMG 31447]|nr:hypothetical protein [Spirosoma utsteinense]
GRNYLIIKGGQFTLWKLKVYGLETFSLRFTHQNVN